MQLQRELAETTQVRTVRSKPAVMAAGAPIGVSRIESQSPRAAPACGAGRPKPAVRYSSNRRWRNPFREFAPSRRRKRRERPSSRLPPRSASPRRWLHTPLACGGRDSDRTTRGHAACQRQTSSPRDSETCLQRWHRAHEARQNAARRAQLCVKWRDGNQAPSEPFTHVWRCSAEKSVAAAAMGRGDPLRRWRLLQRPRRAPRSHAASGL
mmetsp:Transcript_47758/g.158242  ORF Transcript_47758/g.158242 Transcript_47758/m.158242 type:complete len:210 (-) Transcript_47758:51-680(-)